MELAERHRLAGLTRAEALGRARAGAVGLLPIGSLEQHGEHLPLFTDSLLAESVCLRAAERATVDVLVAPPLWPGFSPHHVAFGATVSLSSGLFLAVVREVAEGLLAWLPRLVVVNGHGGNRGPLLTLALERGFVVVSYWELAAGDAAAIFPADGGSIGHAGEAETGMMLAAFPALVGEPGRDFAAPRDGDLLPHLGESGVIGDARAASPEAGRTFLDAAASALARVAESLAAEDDEAFPVSARAAAGREIAGPAEGAR